MSRSPRSGRAEIHTASSRVSGLLRHVDRIDEYRKTLEAHSGPLLDLIAWRLTPQHNVEMLNDSADLYRYFDATETAEFLSCVERIVEYDLPREIDYLRRHDLALRRIINMVEMLDRVAENLLMFIRQNKGTMPKRRRTGEFKQLIDDEVEKVEAVVNDASRVSDRPKPINLKTPTSRLAVMNSNFLNLTSIGFFTAASLFLGSRPRCAREMRNQPR
jgi:hypothetical protein